MAKNQRALRTKFAALLITLSIPLTLSACAFHASGSAKTSANAKSDAKAKSDANAKSESSNKSSSRFHASTKSGGGARATARAKGTANGSASGSASGKAKGDASASAGSSGNGSSKVVFKSKSRSSGVAKARATKKFKATFLVRGGGSVKVGGKGSASGSGSAGGSTKKPNDKDKTATKKPKGKDKTATKKPKGKDKTATKKPVKEPTTPEEVTVIDPPADPPDNVFGYEDPVRGCFEGIVYPLAKDATKLPTAWDALTAVSVVYACEWDIPTREWETGFPGVADRFEWFAIQYTGSFAVENAGEWKFRISSDDGTKLFIDGKLVLDNDGQHPPKSKEATVKLTKGDHDMVLEYFQGPRYHINLQVYATPPGGEEGIFSVR